MDTNNCIICFENEVEICCKFCTIRFHYKCLKQYNKTECPQCKKLLPIIFSYEIEDKQKQDLEIILSCLTILNYMKIFEEEEQRRIEKFLLKQRFNNEEDLISEYLEPFSTNESNGIFILIELANCCNLEEAPPFHTDYFKMVKYFEDIKTAILKVVEILENFD